jgi:DNA-binding NarL/FixJ family response regulator
MNFFNTTGPKFRSELPQEAFPELTPRELEVLELIAQGASNNQIAEKLVITVKTVRNHVNSIFSKLQVADRAAAIIQARDAGLGKSN